jgi:hypothetical protein
MQLLELPSIVRGDDVIDQYALVVDQLTAADRDANAEAFNAFAQAIGARGVLYTELTVEVASVATTVETDT